MARLDRTIDRHLSTRRFMMPYLVVAPSLAEERKAIVAQKASDGGGEIVHTSASCGKVARFSASNDAPPLNLSIE
jgi:hypothetical protein